MKTRLSAREKDILGRIGLNADKSLRQLARISGHQLHSVRYTLARLEERKILNRAWVVDIFQLGWQRFQVLIAVGGAKREQLIKFFCASNRVGHLAEIGGEFDYDLLVLGRDVREVLELLREASRLCGNIFVDKAVAIQSRMAYFPRKYFCTGKPNIESLVLGENRTIYSLRPDEQLILEILTRQPQISRKDLANKLKVSLPTIDSRLKALKQGGVLRGAMFSPRYIELGAQNYKLLMTSSGVNEKFANSLYKFGLNHPHCTSYREGIGAWDYELNVEVENHEQLTSFKNELWQKFSTELVSLQVLPRFRLIKFTSYPLTAAEVFAK